MIYGYARVSTAAQDLDGQLAQLRAAGCERVFREKVTGAHAERPQLKRMLDVLAPGDLVVTPAVDRISRDTTDLLVIAREIERAGAGLRSLAEPVVDTTSDFKESGLNNAQTADLAGQFAGSGTLESQGSVGTGLSSCESGDHEAPRLPTRTGRPAASASARRD